MLGLFLGPIFWLYFNPIESGPRREGVLHQVQKLMDPDNPICTSQYNESPLASASMGWGGHGGHGAGTPLSHHHYHQHHPHHHHQHGHGSGRTWTVSGSSLANMFPEQLRVPKRRDAQ